MKAAVALGMAIVLLWLVAWHIRANRQMAEDKRTIAELTEKQTAMDEEPSLELQSRCASAAKNFFDRFGYTPDQRADYTNHYNPKLRKCFIAIKTGQWQKASETMLTSQAVFDAVEGKSYGEYVWQSDKIKKYWEVPPIECDGTDVDGNHVPCHSDVEFSTLMSNYMDIDN
jgi:hypothetical protein